MVRLHILFALYRAAIHDISISYHY